MADQQDNAGNGVGGYPTPIIYGSIVGDPSAWNPMATEVMARQQAVEAQFRAQAEVECQRNEMMAQVMQLQAWQYIDVSQAAQAMLGTGAYIRGAARDYELEQRGEDWFGKFTCGTTGIAFELASDEKQAVERGMGHYVNRWRSALSSLHSAGLKDDELRWPMERIGPRLETEARREHDLELGVRRAETKARNTLLLCLTPAQKDQFNADQSFTVDVAHVSDRWPSGKFRIKKASSFNVEHLDSKEKFCVVAAESVPVYDQMLTQKLLLENEPRRFFETANRTGGGIYEMWDEMRATNAGRAALEGRASMFERLWREWDENHARRREEAAREVGRASALAPPPTPTVQIRRPRRFRPWPFDGSW